MNKQSRSDEWIEVAETREPRKVTRSERLRDGIRQPGFLAAIPISILFVVGFLAPLTVVFLFAFMPPETFSLLQIPTLANFKSIFSDSYYLSFLASLELASYTVAILLVICYPAGRGDGADFSASMAASSLFGGGGPPCSWRTI